MTDEFRRFIRQRQYAWTHNQHGKYKIMRNKVNRLSKQLRQHFCSKQVHDMRRCNARNWWRHTKQLTGQSGRPELTTLANTYTDENMEKLADLINRSLQAVTADFVPLSTTDSASTTIEDQSIDDQYFIQPYQVYNKLSRIDIHKSVGPDNIPNWVLRDFAFALSDPICHIFNASVQSATVPEIWKKAFVVPIPKVNPPTSIDTDLRPISLTATLSKILESFVGGWMLEKVSHKFDSFQYGALAGRSTTHELVHLLHVCHQAVDNHQSVRAVFVDFSKAFDRVDHALVLKKMSHMGVQPFITDWMHSFLLHRKQCVKLGKVTSTWVTLNGGMPQGTWFGPYVFLIHINDLKTAQTTFKFVDDVTVVEFLNSTQSSEMQSAVEVIANWSALNHMQINTAKTKAMYIKPASRLSQLMPTLSANNCPIEEVTSFKLLGVILSDDLRWKPHVDHTIAKASKRLHFLKLLKRSGMSPDDLLYYYKAVIRSVIEYACPAWQSSLSAYDMHRLESIQKRAIRVIFGSNDYEFYCVTCGLELLQTRLNNLSQTFFQERGVNSLRPM